MTGVRALVASVLVLSLSGGGPPATAPRPGVTAGPAAPVVAVATPLSYRLPVEGRVLVPFAPPATPYGAGHRGVDLAAAQGASVLASAPGTVVFAGSVAGRGVVVIAHADGLRTEYEPVRPRVRVGAPVTAGEAVGVLTGVHAACAPASCLHWSARRGDVYVDPLALLAPLGPVRLLPWSEVRRAGGRG